MQAKKRLGIFLLSVLPLFSGCAGDGFFARLGGGSQILARDSEFVIVQVGMDDARSLAKRFLGDTDRYWVIEDANESTPISYGQQIVIPLKDRNPTGVDLHGYQTVPILCYHRFGDSGDQLEISAIRFREQLNYLKTHHYRVIPLSDLMDFLRGEHSLPKRSVVLTIDDGHRSIYKIAYPLLKEFGFPATLFVYTDYIEHGGLRWKELDEMVESGLISVQPHSKSHDNLIKHRSGEGRTAYRRRLRYEVNEPTSLLRRRFNRKVAAYAYPYGDTSPKIIDELRVNGLHLGLTVQPLANAAFTYPYLLRRTMIFSDRGLKAFKAALKVYQPRKAS